MYLPDLVWLFYTVFEWFWYLRIHFAWQAGAPEPPDLSEVQDLFSAYSRIAETVERPYMEGAG